MQKEFDLEYQYQFYLKLVKVKESDMGEVQKKEMKQVFFGACGIMLSLLRDELSKLPEDEAIAMLQNMLNQVGKYYFNAANKSN